MQWNSIEITQGAELASNMDLYKGPRNTFLDRSALKLRLSDAEALKEGLLFPRNWGALLVRHLFKALQFNEERLFRWRIEHKLTQALVFNHYCPGSVPVTRGLGRELSSGDPSLLHSRLQELSRPDIVVKLALGEASGELRQFDQSATALKGFAENGSSSCPSNIWEERYVIQERLRIRQEYRVHSFEDQVVPDLTFRRYSPAETTLGERRIPNAFVQYLLDRFPSALVKDTLYGWDVALDDSGRWYVIEANLAGYHPVFKPGFHCSGFFQTPPWAAPALGRLLTFVSERCAVDIKIELDVDDVREETSTYWWAAQCQELIGIARANRSDADAGRGDDEAVVTEQMDLRLSTEQNMFRWALAECRAALNAKDKPRSLSLCATAHRRAEDSSYQNIKADRTASGVLSADRLLSPQLSASDGHLLPICGWNLRTSFAPTQSVHRLFEAQVGAQPDAAALVTDEETVTYAGLNERVNRLAHYLRALGVTHEMRAGVYVHRSVNLVVGLLAIMKAGGAYVPLDPPYPIERLRYILKDAKVTILLSETTLCGNLSDYDGTIIRLDSDMAKFELVYTDDPDWRLDIDNCAYVIYTSGSTGRPKAVAIQHAGLTNVICDLQARLGINANDRWLAVTAVSFDIAGLEIYLPLISGAQIWLTEREDIGDGFRLKSRLTQSDATVMQATPSTWQLLVDAGWTGKPSFKALSGGEGLPRVLASQLAERVAKVWNLYGPTETTIWSSLCPISGREARAPIGQPIANTRLYILDEEMRPQPPDIAGELYIGGTGVGRGYLNLPGLTAERFVADPYSTSPGRRLYKTGDWARWADGQLECLGRIDHQVKIHGVRVELGEVEEVLRSHPDVKEAVVMAHDDAAKQKRLVAYIVYRSGAATTISALQKFLRARLPSPMLPTSFVAMDELPRTSNRKVDRGALPLQYRPTVRPALEYVAPQTETETVLAQIWSAVLDVKDVSIDDNFIDLGGHSVSAIQCVNRIRDHFEVDLPLITLFVQTPTVRAIAGMIDECLQRSDDAAH